MEKWKRIIKNLLLAFVLISIGFALGKNFTQSKETQSNPSNLKGHEFVRVYYLHSTFRCTTCNSIEKRTKEILDSDFRADIANGLIQWKTDDFQENEVLAKKFDVIASCVVVALVKGDEVVFYRRLDDTWTLLDKPAEFDSYIRSNIQEVLEMRQKKV
ncbi:MAG: nitrophenyl compound nitroreductase subunit ArsF family protein [Lentisphaerota bacterium]